MTLLCAMNDNGTFSKSFNCIYPGELETKLEQSGEHTCFLDLVIKIEDGVFTYKLFDKRDKFPSTIFCCSLYIQKYTEIFSRMLSQQANRSCFNKHSKSFSKIFFNYYLAAPLSTLGHY